MTSPVLSVGVDLAAQNANTAVCVMEWHPDRAVAHAPIVSEKGDTDGWIMELVAGAAWVGIDAPFGWPDAIVRALPIWAAEGRWTPAGKTDLTYRLTDQIVTTTTRRRPLSVSSDRIAITAWRCARLLDQLGQARGRPISRVGDDHVYEVYPGAALTCWEFDRVGYKNRGKAADKTKQRTARIALLGDMQLRAPWLDIHAIADACHISDHALDALVAALVARAAGVGLTGRPGPTDDAELRRIEREGWIHLPTGRDTFAQLLRATSPPR